MDPYDINLIFAQMEQDLIASYKRNMSHHLKEEEMMGFSWPMWQQQKLADLQAFKEEARVLVNKSANKAVYASSGIIVSNYSDGKSIVDSLVRSVRGEIGGMSFGRMDRRKIDALMDAVRNDFQDASSATLRLVDDQYRKIVYGAQIAYSAGATTLPKAIDVASRAFLLKGIDSILYSNGSRMNIASYAEMAIRTAAKRAKLTGEGARQNELGISLVQITQYGACSDICLPYQGKVFVDDVYSGGKPDRVHPLLSTAMAGGLFHPNCRHMSQPWFEGISEIPPALNEAKVRENYQVESRQREIERNIRKYKRLKAGSLDEANRARADAKVSQWQEEMREHLDRNPELSRKYSREKVV